MNKHSIFLYSERQKEMPAFFIAFTLLFCFSLSGLYAESSVLTQQRTIQGQVLDVDGASLIGVSIMQKGTSTGTISDYDGNFSLLVTGENPIIIFSYVGYVTQEIKVSSRTNLNITLREDSQILDELIVVGYGSRRKGNLAASVSTVKSEDILRSVSTTTAGALVGKVAGVTARQKSGVPGLSTNLEIRNMGTPLYVIDGIMTDEDAFNHLNAEDIDNISILKDGAAAIYGVKASNGVVFVTTKSGSYNQKTQINLNAYTGWQQWTKYPKLLNAYEWNYANDMADVLMGNLSAEAIQQKREELEKWKTGYYNPETGEDYRGYNWYDNYVSNAAPQNYVNLNISGGTDKSTYYFSLSHVDQDAVLKDYTFNRTNLTANFNVNLTDRFKLGFKILGKIETRINPALPGDDDYQYYRKALYNLLPINRPYANDNEDYLNHMSGYDGEWNIAALSIDNAGEYRKKTQAIQPILNLEYDIPIPGLTFKSLFSYSFSNRYISNFEKGWKEYSYDWETDTYKEEVDRVALGQTYLGKNIRNIEELNGQVMLDFDKTFARKHQVTAVGGFEFYKKIRMY